MFESVVRTVLNKFLGDYVSNLETNQLNVGIFSGNVVLHGLTLKREALDKLNLPITVYQGYLGKFELQIPWTNLKQQPVIVSISDLFILAGPKIYKDVDPAEEAEKDYKNKMEKLETYELFSLDNASNGQAAEKVMVEAQNESFTTQLITKIVDNLQVTIKNIHVRYEDDISHPQKELFSFGFTLENLSAVSTNANWEEAYIADALDKIFKMINLEDLSIYWDSWTKESLKGLDQDAFLKEFLALIELEESRNHVLCPITGHAKMVLNKRNVLGEAKTTVNLIFDQFSLLFDDSQYFDLLNLLNFFVLSNRLREFRLIRPTSAPLNVPNEWFKYAIKAYLGKVQEKNNKCNWDFIMERRKNRKAYQELYFQKLQMPNFPPEKAEELEILEKALSFHDLKLYRSLTRKRFQKWKVANEEQIKANQGWFSWLYSPNVDTQPASIADLVKDEDIKELYDAIDFNKNTTADSGSSLDQLFKVNLDLGMLSLNVGKTDKTRENITSVASIVLRLFTSSITKRQSTMKVELSLHELLVIENLLANTLFPEVVRSRSTKYQLEYDDERPFFTLDYDALCENKDAKASLVLQMQPLEITANHQAALLFKDFLLGGRNKELVDNLLGMAADQIGEFKVWTKSSLEKVLVEHKGIDLYIDVEAPILVVPEDCASESAMAFVVDLGHLKVRSKLVTAEQKKMMTGVGEGETVDRVKLNSIKDYLYDYLLTSLTSLQILYFDNLKDCRKMLKGTSKTLASEAQVVDKINLDLQIGSCILPPNSELSGTKIKGTLPMVDVQFSDQKWKCFMKLLDIFLPSKPEENQDFDLSALLNASKSSLFDDRRGSGIPILLPSPVTIDESGDEFQDAVENPEDLRIVDKDEYDQISLEMTFVIEHVRGTVVRRIGKRESIGLIEVESLKVVIENKPWDIVVKTYLKAFKLTELLEENAPKVLVDGKSQVGDAQEGLLAVTVKLVNPIHPLFRDKYLGAGITIDVDISSIVGTLDPPTIMYLIKYVTDTFPPESAPAKPMSRSLSKKRSNLQRGLSKISQSAGLVSKDDPSKEDLSKIIVNVRLLELMLMLGPKQNCFGKVDLRSAAIGITYHGTGKIILQGKLTSFEVIPQDKGIGIYKAFNNRSFASVQGGSVVDFTYETFLVKEAKKVGHDVCLNLKSGSMNLTYMPQFLRLLFNLLAELRDATQLLQNPDEINMATIDELDQKASKFHYEIDILSPVIQICSPADADECLLLYPGNLSVKNTFVVDGKNKNLFDTIIDVALRSMHIDVKHHASKTGPLQSSHFAGHLDVDVRVTQAHSPVERHYAPLDVAVSLGTATFYAGNTEYTLMVGLINWFLATYPTVMDKINLFLQSGGGPKSPMLSPVEQEKAITMELKVDIAGIDAKVFNYSPSKTPDVEAEAVPLSDLSFKKIEVEYLAYSSGTFSAEASILGISFSDTRPDPARRFHEIMGLGVGKSTPEAPMLLVRYEKLVKSKQVVVKSTLDTPKLILVLDHMFSLKRFFSDGLPGAPLIVDPEKAIVQPVVIDAEWNHSTMVGVERTKIYLLEDPYNAASEAIELALPEILYTSNHGNSTLTMEGLGMSLLNMDNLEGTKLGFIDPFDIITTIEGLEGQGSKYVINISPIVMRFAYQDIAMFQALIGRFTSLNRGDAAPHQLDEELDLTVQRMTNLDLDAEETTSTGSSKSIYSLNLESFRAVFVDDFSKVNRPFVEMLLSNASGEFCQSGQMPLTGQAAFLAQVSSYNVANSHWEPVLERMKMVLSVSPESQEIAGKSVWYPKALLTSDNSLEMLVTSTFLQQVSEFTGKLAAEGEAKLTADREVILPFVIHNATGVDLEFWVSTSRRSTLRLSTYDGAAQPSTTKVAVQKGTKVPWTYQDWRSLRSSTEALIPKLAVSLTGTEFESVRDISIEKTGIFSYGLRPKLPDGTSQRLIIEITVKNGVKHIYMRPPIIFYNDGKFPLELQLDETTEITIAAGKTGSFPIGVPLKGLKVRPGGIDYGWCDEELTIEIDLFRPSRNKDLHSLTCHHQQDEKLHPPFYYVFFGQLDSGLFEEDCEDLSRIVGRIQLRAPLQFMNQLPYKLSYRVYDKSCGFDFGASLAPGATVQLHYLHAHHVVGLSIEIPDAGLQSTEISLINEEDPTALDKTIPLVDASRIRTELGLAFQLKKGGTRKVILYAPYALVNLTGQAIDLMNNTMVKSNQLVSGVASSNKALEDDGSVRPILYSYPEAFSFRNRIKVRLAQADWSRPVSMESVGIGDWFDVQDEENNLWYNLAMTVQMGPTQFEPCKIVKFLPRFVLVNASSMPLVLFSDGAHRFNVDPNSQIPIHVPPEKKASVCLAYQLDSEIIKTAVFRVEEIGKTFLKAPGSKTGLLRVDRLLQETTIYISVKDEATWPFQLVNESSFDLRYSQSPWQSGHEPTALMLMPGESIPFAWEEPSAKDRKLILEAGTKKIPIDIYDIGQLQPTMIKLPGGQKKSLSIDIAADGPVLQVIFRDWDASKSLFQYRRRSPSMASTSGSPAPEDDSTFEVKSVAVQFSSILQLKLPSIGITLVNRYLEEILYASAKDLELRYSASNLHYTYGLTVQWIQMDNQLFDDWDHPILLYPAVISKKAQFKAGEEGLPPFLSVALIQSVDAAHGVKYFKYAGFLLQEVVIDLGEHLMHKLVDYFSALGASGPVGKIASLLAPGDLMLPNMVKLDMESDHLYFELLQLHPIHINFTFSKADAKPFDEAAEYSQQGQHPTSGGLDALANVFTTVVGSVSNAPLKFNALILEHPIVRQNVLLALIQQHYSQQAISQLYRVIGSADFIGNPVGLFSTFGSGVSDFFYEPLLGLVSDRPGDIGIGLAKGSFALVRKTVVGLTDTFAKFTGSIGKGATMLTFDPAFQQKRRNIQARNRPKHAVDGVVASAKHLFSGVTSGITGIVEKPVEGAKEGGIGGFFKGVGVGLVGIVAKPVVGVIDATTSLTEGIKNTADTDANDVGQVRLPRPVPYDGVLHPYNLHEARGQALLYTLHQREQEYAGGSCTALLLHHQRREYYVAHLEVPADDALALITTEAIILLDTASTKIIWRVPLDEVTYVRPHRDVILLVVRQAKIKQRMIFVADPALQEWFSAQVEQAMLIFNEQRHQL